MDEPVMITTTYVIGNVKRDGRVIYTKLDSVKIEYDKDNRTPRVLICRIRILE